jgi:putative membrane-bound dehydrogenase-like protein
MSTALIRGLVRCSVPWLLACLSMGGDAAEPQVDASQMPRVPATEAGLAARTFAVKPGFEAQLVASEPLVMSPVALDIDERGAVFLVEMRDYSERREEHLGRIRKLVDMDLDGDLDAATVLCDGLPWPTAVTCWDGGVFVGATPDIWYFKDADGDGRAEVRERIFTGFGSDGQPLDPKKLNVQAMLNSFHWGMDQRIHGATSMAGGRVRLVDSAFVRAWRAKAGIAGASLPEALALRGRDFAFDPRTLEMVAEPGGGQHGMSFDSTGRKFVCSNSDHLQQILFDDAGIPVEAGQSLPANRASIAADGPAAPVYRRSPDEPWRVLRTRWRVSGLVEGMIEGGGRPSGYFTGATGVTIHRGDAYPADVAGDAFIADCGSNLIHRKRLRLDGSGIQLVGERVAGESTNEFLASTDNWFRPVQFVNTPDGCLWVIDMYRETIEHPWSLPEGLKKHLDLNSGHDRGRLWRLAPAGLDVAARTRRVQDLAKADTAGLVSLLDHPNGWHRDTASRLLHQRQDPAAIGLMRVGVIGARSAFGRLHLLRALAAASGLDARSVAMGLADPDEAVRAATVEMASQAHGVGSIPWRRLASDPSARVRLAVSRQVTKVDADERPAVLAALVAAGPDLVRSIALASAGGRELALWESVRKEAPEVLPGLARRLGKRHAVGELQGVLGDLAGLRPRSLRLSTAASLGIGLADAGKSLRLVDTEHRLASVWDEAARLADDPTASRVRTVGKSDVASVDLNPDDPAARLAAVRLMALAPEAEAIPVLVRRLGSEPDDVLSVAVEGLARFRGAAWASAVSGRLQGASATLRARVVGLLLRRAEGRAAIVRALDQSWIRVADLDADAIASLRRAADPELKADVKRWLGEPAADRRAVLDRYLPALSKPGDAARGGPVFEQRCAACHRLKGVGNVLGPDLASVASNGPEKLMMSILDPNREVAPNFMAWRGVLKDGEEVSGILVRDDGPNLVFRQAGGQEVVVVRDRLASLENSGRSLMPEGLEEGLDPRQLADLLAYLAK